MAQFPRTEPQVIVLAQDMAAEPAIEKDEKTPFGYLHAPDQPLGCTD